MFDILGDHRNVSNAKVRGKAVKPAISKGLNTSEILIFGLKHANVVTVVNKSIAISARNIIADAASK